MWELQESPPSPRAVELRYWQVVSVERERPRGASSPSQYLARQSWWLVVQITTEHFKSTQAEDLQRIG